MSSKKPDGGPAFPNPAWNDVNGMTLRVYAAIQLRVPDSGHVWLDEMIRQAQRDQFAGQLLPGILAYSGGVGDIAEDAREAYKYADSMLEERKEAYHAT